MSKKLKLEKLCTFLDSQGLYYQAGEIRLLEDPYLISLAQQQQPPPVPGAATNTQQQQAQGSEEGQQAQPDQQQIQVMTNNLNQAVNAFAQVLGAIAGSPEATMKLLRYIQKVTSGPIYEALMKAVASDADIMNGLLKKAQQQQQQPQGHQGRGKGRGNVIQQTGWIAKIVAQAPKLKRYGEAVMTAVTNLMSAAHPDMTGGYTSEWVANAQNYLNQAIDKNTALPNEEAKTIIKGLISSLIPGGY
jgi:hypothetical protein